MTLTLSDIPMKHAGLVKDGSDLMWCDVQVKDPVLYHHKTLVDK